MDRTIPNSPYTVRPLFKKFTQHCETYEPTNCCVNKTKKKTTTCVKLYTICVKLYTSCVIFYTTVGRFICFTLLCKVLNSGLTVYVSGRSLELLHLYKRDCFIILPLLKDDSCFIAPCQFFKPCLNMFITLLLMLFILFSSAKC